ncbi:MAG: hypothetical protein CVU56_01415 [Deltaproteobacteria bacterium HGW-Deltaproteobacteria-14]|jgi:serine/threonine-protein kinase|nr:MAG: hypothetical protein CVU56_01415 [Deltaproteobacteria bacterium HGW-Deltaproteobacteria-14]
MPEWLTPEVDMDIREPRPGEVLGLHYVIESELGRGGFGVVFKARHLDIDRMVALKVLLATYGKKDPTAVDRFRREATIAASLSYPNTVRVFDYGETDEGVFYLIMEFIQGKDLTHVIAREGRIPVRRSIHIVRQILHAMMEAHSRGIVHRDIKPDNVMLVPLGYDPDFVKVMDFGIAKMVTGGQTLTQAGLTLGTPRYMPLEQLKGADVTPATDLYAVGLVLYEMLLGRPAFDGDSAVDCAVKVMESPTLRIPDEVGVPRELALVIERACAKQAEGRFQSAREFLNALNHLDPALLDIDPGDEQLDAGMDPKRGEGAHETTVMPELDGPIPAGGDFEDALRTIALHAGSDVAPARPVEGERRPQEVRFRGAETQAVPILDPADLRGARAAAAAAAAAEPRAPRTSGPVIVPKVREEERAALANAAADATAKVLRGETHTSIGLQIAALVLLVVIALKLFLG